VECRIHRGAHEIGGNCVELESGGFRLILDLGRPLTAALDEVVPLPAIAGLASADASIVGVVITHGHPDHWGLVGQLPAAVPLFVGAGAEAVLRAASFWSPAGIDLQASGFLRDRVPFAVGPFTVTPYLADHSAFDAYSLLVEADGRRLFYSGDLRGHGRKHSLQQLILDPPRDLDVLVLEGTRILAGEADPSRAGLTERELEDRLVEQFSATDGMVLACYSAQNIDRLVSVYEAARRARRLLVVDLYTAEIAAATGHDAVPQAHWDDVRVFVPRNQRVRIKRAGAFDRIDRVRATRIFPEELAARRAGLVMTFRGSMRQDMDAAACLEGASCVWSLWSGYLRDASGETFVRWLDLHGIGLHEIHSSGHATIDDLQRLVAALGCGRVVPIHSSAPERFATVLPGVERHDDLEWWSV
jgi:ribonuclease J